MKATIQVESPDDINFTLKMTMKLSEWKRLQEQLANHHPAWELSSKISEMVRDANRVFYAGEAGKFDDEPEGDGA